MCSMSLRSATKVTVTYLVPVFTEDDVRRLTGAWQLAGYYLSVSY